YSNYLTLAFLALTLVFMFINPETRYSILVGVVFLVIMTLIYFRKYAGNKEETL
ncbi:amino acid permease, partial [Streptococcus thermophilus]|nr:amino acid permease [Streptococcus thermophilus]